MTKCGLPEPPPLCKAIMNEMGDEMECPSTCPHIGDATPFVGPHPQAQEMVAQPGPVQQAVKVDAADELPTMDAWKNAQQHELQWWLANLVNSFFEERKQMMMAEKMGLPVDSGYRIDLQGKSVLDVGGGATSLLLKCINGGRRAVLDPLRFPEWVMDRYAAADIDFMIGPAEAMEEEGFDEVWIYNVLQHVRNPKEVLRRAMRAGRTLRIFEWTNANTDIMHLHTVTAEMIESVVGGKGCSETITNVDGLPASAFWGTFECKAETSAEVRPSSSNRSTITTSAVVIPPGTRLDRVDIPHAVGRVRPVLHVPGLPHTITNKDFLSCAYTQKVLKLCAMMKGLGYEVYHYGCEGSEVECTEDVSVVTNEYREKFYPPLSMTKQFTFNIDDEYHHTFRRNVADEIRRRKGERNLLLCAWGFGHKEIADLLGDEALAVESGIGYTDTFSKYRVFESYTWMHWVYGKGVQHDGSWYDAVIPNYFEPGDFEFREEKEDWLLYLGRIIKRKGVELASDLAHRTGHKLVIAGQGTLKNDAEYIDLKGDHIDFVGYADVAKRKDLMSRAKACIMPTYYVEPFGGVAIEAMLSGTPVISTDWGVFSEHTLHGLTGYRCRTMEQFEWAVNHIDRISPASCRQWAIDNYSMDRVAKMYDEYFSMLSDLWRGGWYEPRPDRQDLDWLEKHYPYPMAPAS